MNQSNAVFIKPTHQPPRPVYKPIFYRQALQPVQPIIKPPLNFVRFKSQNGIKYIS
jgi:hypothetical protein